MDDKLNLSVDSSLSESRRRSNRTVKPKRYSPEPVLPKYASIVKKSATKESSSHQNSPMETHLEEIKLQNLSEFYRESLSTLSSLTETNFDVKDLLPKKKRISAKQEKEQMELMPSSSKRRMEPPFELAQSSYDWPHIEATDTDVSKHPELKRIFSQQHGAEEQAPKKKAALKKNERKLLSQSLTGLVSEKLLESEKSGSERKSAKRSRRSAEKLVDTSIVARPELMPEKSESGKKPITESLMPASTEKLVNTSIVAEPKLLPEKSESGKKPIARARRSTENLDASTSEDSIEPTQHAASQSIVASKKKPATKKSDEKAPALTNVELLPEKSDRAKPVIRIRRSTEISDTGESIDRLQVSVTEPVMEKSSPKKPKENFSLSQPGTKLEKLTKPIVGARRSKGMSSSASPATSEISLASTRQPRNKSKSVFELLSPAIVGKRKSSTASKPPSVPPPRAGAETSLSSTSIAPLNIPDYMENQTPVPSIYDSDARQDKLTGLSAFMRHRRDSESSVDLSEHVSGVSSAVQYPRMTVTPGSVGNRVRTLSKAKEILRKDDQSTLTPVKAKKEISPKKSAEKIKMQKEDGEKAMEEKFDLEKEMPDVIVAVPPFIEECETPIVEEPVEYIETGQAEISQKKAKKVTTFEVKKKKTEQRHVFSQSAKAVEPMTTRSMSFKSDGWRRSFAVSQSELRPRSSTLSTISPLPERMQKFHDEFTSALSHSLIHGREPRNKSKPVLELAPSLIKQEKRKLSADTLGPAKRRRTTITDASDILTPPTEPLQISIPSASVPDISATLKEATETLLKSLPPRPELPPIPQIPVFPDVSAAAASTTTPNIRDRAGRSSKQPKHRVFKHHPSQPTTPAQSEISEAQFDFPQKPQQDRYPAYGRVETQPNLIEMSIFDRLAKRKINPLAMGVVPRKEKDYEKEFFYREIFMRNPKHEDEPNEPLPDEIDVVEEEEPITDEVLQTNPADACANDIVAILPRISKVPTEDDSDSESMEYTIDELKELAQYEPQIVSNHLLVLLKWIANQRLTDISTLNVTGGCSMFHSLTLRNANRTREALKLYSNKLMDSIVVAHDWLLPRLATPLLASYLNLLRFLHVAGSGVTKHVTNHDEKRDEKINEANKIIREFSLTKVQDPLGKSIKDNLDRLEKRVNASVLFVSPKITTPNYNPKIRAHETISQMLPTCTKMFESLKLEFVDVQGPINVENLTHMCIKLIKKKVKELVKRRPNDHIFLAGWGTTCLLNHAAVQEVKGVSGLLDFAFPSQTVYGPRGDVEDEILLTYCPTLFIVGEHASDCSLKDIQKLRENMTQENGLIVVGGANSNLYVNALRLSMERVSQRCVARTILEHVVDFMQEVITVAPPPVYSHQALKPIAVVNPFDVETSSLKPSRSEKSSTSAAGGESSKIKGTASQSAASQAIIQARKEKLKKNQDALLQEKLRTLAADAVQPKKSVVSKMRTIAMKPEEIKRSLSQTPLTSPFSQKPQIKQHLQQNLQNPKKQKEFTQIFGEPINLTPARIDFGNKLRQATSSTSAPSHQVYSQQVQPSTSSQPQNRDREETLREEAAAVAALSTQSFITSFPDEPVESMDYDEYGKLL